MAKRLEIRLDKGRSYKINIGRCLLGESVEDQDIQGLLFGKRLLLLSDDNVWPLHKEKAEAFLDSLSVDYMVMIIKAGEVSKSLKNASLIYDRLIDGGFSRDSVLMAFGGGVVGDLGGFAAATYMRGISFLQVPTTLLAQIDSSVGGKVAVNHRKGKNLIGSFYQPVAVIADTSLLETLDERNYASGLAEVIKYGVIHDRELFNYIEERRERIRQRDPEALERIIEWSCRIKGSVVEADERESGLREILNYGHTIGHALESAGGYGRLLHGEAVAIGMAAASRLSERIGVADEMISSRLEHLLKFFNLPTHSRDIPIESLLDGMKRDKKVREGQIRFVLHRSIGRVELVQEIEDNDIAEAIKG